MNNDMNGKKRARKLLTPQEVLETVARTMRERPHSAKVFLLALHLGVRPSEIADVGWSELDLGGRENGEPSPQTGPREVQ